MTMHNKVYLAGPMTGIPEYNFPAFDAAAQRWMDMGYVVISPAELDREMGFDETRDVPTAADLRAMLVNDVIELTKCDSLALLKGWEKSSGTAVELAVARFLKMPVYNAEDFTRLE